MAIDPLIELIISELIFISSFFLLQKSGLLKIILYYCDIKLILK